MSFRRLIALHVVCILALAPLAAPGQDPARRGRKYKAPPDTSHIEVLVLKKFNGKPIVNAAVVFNPSLNGKDEGNLEVKTNPEGKAIIDVIPTGSLVRVQIIANGFATFAEDYLVTEATREIVVPMLRPQEQISAYQDNSGKDSSRKVGVQEQAKPRAVKPPVTPKPAAVAPAVQAAPAPTAGPKQ